jgi:lauroyl/myristoyl acyltransferase
MFLKRNHAVPFFANSKLIVMKYTDKLKQLSRYYMHESATERETITAGKFELVSAGLVNYLPAIDANEHASVYRQLLLHQQLSVLEQYEPAVLDKISCEGDAAASLQYMKDRPSIVCTMHTGSYRVLNLYLLQQGISFALVAGSTVLEQEGNEFRKMYRLLGEKENTELQLIDAEQSHAGLQMLRALKTGKSLVLYLDGHTGAGTKTNENVNSCVVDFLNQQLYVRKGIAYLAHAAKVPVFPVACYRKSIEDIRLLFYAPVPVNELMSRDDFAITTTQQLYTLFGELIAGYPEQWEGWLTIHQHVKLINRVSVQGDPVSKKGENLVFASDRSGIFKTGGMPFLLDKHHYLFYPVDEALFDVLYSCKQEGIERTHINDELLESLLDMGVVLLV